MEEFVDLFKLLFEGCLSYFHLIFSDWGLAIIALALAIRVVLFPIQTFNFIQQRRLQKIQPEVDQLTADFKGDPLRALKEIQELKKKKGIKTWAMLIVSLAQIPVFLGMYQAITSARNLAEVPFIWISSLATPDAFYVLPLLVAVTTYFQLRNNVSSSAGGKAQAAFLTKLLPAVNFFFMAAMPSALVLYYATSGVFQFVSETALRRIVE